MDLLFTLPGVMSLLIVIALFVKASRSLTLGPLSLPGVLCITTLVYFYLIPAILVARDEVTMFGWHLDTIEPIHIASTVYLMGASIAFIIFRKTLSARPTQPLAKEPALRWRMFCVLLAVAVSGVAAQVFLGNLNLFASEDYVIRDSASEFLFLNLSFSMLIPLSLVLLVQWRFNLLSILFLAAVVVVFITVGFRFRIVILLTASVSAYSLLRNRKITLLPALGGVAVALLMVNILGQVRSYYRGIDLSALEGASFLSLLTNFGGEAGPIFTLSHLLANPPDWIGFDPWWIAVARFVPSFVWPSKPYPEYLLYYANGFPDPAAQFSGVAAPHHGELFLMFGWAGLPVLSFLHYSAACLSLGMLRRLGVVGRIVGYSILPSLIGFYMVQRGYLFQQASEYIFTFLPLFLLYRKQSKGKIHTDLQKGTDKNRQRDGATNSARVRK